MTTHSRTDWVKMADGLAMEGRPFINGGFVDCPERAAFSVTYPGGERAPLAVVDCGEAEVATAVEGARSAWISGWRDAAPAERRRLLLLLADAVHAHGDELALCDTLNVGKPIAAARGEVVAAAGFIRYYAEMIDKALAGEVAPTGRGVSEVQLWRPRGVVGAITPWNFPLINACLKIGPALAAGNTVVMKPSELSPHSTLRLAALASEAGFPPGVLNVVTGGGEAGAALAGHPGVDLLTFTGSSTTGAAVLRASGSNGIRPALLECGGKCPEILFDDIASLGLEEVARQLVGAAMWNQGQVCVARSRVLVQREIYEAMVDAIAKAAQELVPEDPLEPASRFGPLASARQADRVRSYIEAGLDSGARLLVDGRGSGETCVVGPTVFADVDPSSRIAREEIFGPVLALMPFEDEAQALQLANDSAYGLAATVWTTDIRRSQRMIDGLELGKLRVIASLEPGPGAGFAHSAEPARQSGFGVEGGVQGLRSYMRRQSVETQAIT